MQKIPKTECNLLNYTEFLVALQNTLAAGFAPKSTQATFLEVCINNYPNIISWYDYVRANEIVAELVGRFAEILDGEDSLSRMHLDRVWFLLKGYTAKELEKAVKKIHDVVENFENKLFRKPMHIVASIGSVNLPKSNGTVDEILHKAYIARTSANGTNSLYYARFEDMESGLIASRNEAQVMYDVQQIIDNERFQAAYQPIICAKTGETEYYECLLRITSPGEAPVSAGGLIPIAEKMNFIKVIDRIMLQKVVEQLRQNPKLKLTFNISNATTDDAEWLKMCSKLLKNTSISSRILIEITETAAHRDLRGTAYFVASLQGLGCQVALDDFGAGYTSFRQLKALSVDMVKIDGAYIKDITSNRDNQTFVKTLIDFTSNYGLKTVAEFVETGDVAKMLLDMNVDYLQGYYFGKPQMDAPWKE